MTTKVTYPSVGKQHKKVFKNRQEHTKKSARWTLFLLLFQCFILSLLLAYLNLTMA